jgi:hypothetical protein
VNIKGAYAVLLRLYPADHRALFAAEMLATFNEAAEENQAHGRAAFIRFIVAELIGLVTGVSAEWVARFTYSIYHSNNYISGRCLADPGVMRPAGVARESFSSARPTCPDGLIRETGMCVNAHQRFVVASPLRRLLILTCGVFLPMHPRLDEETRVWKRHD